MNNLAITFWITSISLLVIESGGHLLLDQERLVQQYIEDFINSNR